MSMIRSKLAKRQAELQVELQVEVQSRSRDRGSWQPPWVLAAALPAQAHIVPVADMLRGIRMTPAQCAAIPMTVWLKVMGRDFCIRYYLSTAGGDGSRPVVFLQGDRFGRFDRKTNSFSPGPNDKDIDTDDFVRFADGLSKQTKTTAIYLARVGVEGSSGDHRIRHSVLELNVTNAALDAIKRRHHFDGFHLVGQSGGSTLFGGMLALRSDIGCAVLGSGPARLAPAAAPLGRSRRDYFNVADGIAAIAQRRATRILVVTDPADQKVPERSRPPSCEGCGRPAARPSSSWCRRSTTIITASSPMRSPPRPAACAAPARRTSRSTSSGWSRNGSRRRRRPMP